MEHQDYLSFSLYLKTQKGLARGQPLEIFNYSAETDSDSSVTALASSSPTRTYSAKTTS